MSEWYCYFCNRGIPKSVVEACKKGGVQVRCPCRPGAIGPSEFGDGSTIVRMRVKHETIKSRN